MAELRTRQGMASLALQFAILTCVRSFDVRDAKHADVDRVARVWAIPKFTKTGKVHKIPLSDAALDVFDKARVIAAEIGGQVSKSAFIFPNEGSGARLSENTMLAVIGRMGFKGRATGHGFRASFRTWAQEQSRFPWELSEMTLGHSVGSAVERAYARSDLFAKHVAIMQAWANFCDRPAANGSKVVSLRPARTA